MNLNTLVLKVASRCNLNCTYCYVYNLGDLTYLDQPKYMSAKVVNAILQKVSRHCEKHNIRGFHFVFHGGEPLLQSMEFFSGFINKAREVIKPQTHLHFAVQTNGVLLTKEWCDFFLKEAITIGISLDGYEEIHDSKRVDHAGKGSYQKVIEAINLVNSYQGRLNLGILTVINTRADPDKLYQQIKGLNIRSFNLLLPYASWDVPPPDWVKSKTVYADWLIRIFDRWYFDDKPKPSIPIFEQILGLCIGLKQSSQYFGGEKLDFLIIETDGSIEVSGALKVCGHGMTKENMNILEMGLDNALQNNQLNLHYNSHQELPFPCCNCKVVNICGGGFLPNRYSAVNGFNNRSVYCHDSLRLICHIHNTLMDSLPQKVLSKAKKNLLSYDHVFNEIHSMISY